MNPPTYLKGPAAQTNWTQPVELSKHNREKSLKQWIVEDDEGSNTAIDLSQVRVKKNIIIWIKIALIATWSLKRNY